MGRDWAYVCMPVEDVPIDRDEMAFLETISDLILAHLPRSEITVPTCETTDLFLAFRLGDPLDDPSSLGASIEDAQEADTRAHSWAKRVSLWTLDLFIPRRRRRQEASMVSWQMSSPLSCKWTHVEICRELLSCCSFWDAAIRNYRWHPRQGTLWWLLQRLYRRLIGRPGKQGETQRSEAVGLTCAFGLWARQVKSISSGLDFGFRDTGLRDPHYQLGELSVA
jgi:hypothetical protein